MPAIVVRNLSLDLHRKLKARARKHGRSTEAEVRAILTQAAEQPEGVGLGTQIHRFAMQFGGIELDIERDRRPAEGAKFD